MCVWRQDLVLKSQGNEATGTLDCESLSFVIRSPNPNTLHAVVWQKGYSSQALLTYQ